MVYEGFGSIRVLQVKRHQWFANKGGNYSHNDIIGKRYGCVVQSRKGGSGTVTILAPTPQLWTAALPLRTQILFQTDIAMVLHHLNIKAGSVVVEAGTGSGSLSTSIARAIAPHGHLHTFEFNAERVKRAQEDFKQNKIDHLITVRHRDVCAKGFPKFTAGVDAWFLDLPTPWVVLDDVNRSLRPQGRICSFSPCIEQVQRTCLKLSQLKYLDVITVECLIRPLEVYRPSPYDAPIDIPGCNLPAPPRASRFKRVQQSSAAATTAASSPSSASSATEVESGEQQGAETDLQSSSSCAQDGSAETIADVSTTPATLGEERSHEAMTGESPKPPRVIGTMEHVNNLLAGYPAAPFTIRPSQIMRGHTGYLTFATKPAGVHRHQPAQNSPSATVTSGEIQVVSKSSDSDAMSTQ